jgi:predicted Ser/Thr protein kinase
MPVASARWSVEIPERLAAVQAALGHGFRVEGLLGRGGFGEVWAVHDIQLGRTVAVKVLRSELFAEPSYRERFRREARAIAKLRHPGIVPVYHVGESNGLAYFVMPLVDGTTLKARLMQPGGVPPDEAVRILVEAAAALREAHAAGIVHRDLKPENIMLEGPQRRVLLMDFGVAKMDEPGSGEGITETDTVIGSPEYMSPEQATGRALDARSDLYSLGVIGYRMLAGKLPFDAETPREVLAHHVLTPPEPLGHHVTLPGPLTETVMRCLAKSPDDRWASAEELHAALSAKDLRRSLVLAGTGERRERPPGPPGLTSPTRVLGPSRRRQGLVVAATIGVLLLLASPWPIARWRVQRRGALAAEGLAGIYRNAADSARALGRAFTGGAITAPWYAEARQELLLSVDERAEATYGAALDDSTRWRPATRRAVVTAMTQLAAAGPAVATFALRPSDVIGCRLRSAGDTLEARDDVTGDNCWFQAISPARVAPPVEYFASFRAVPRGPDAGIGLAWCRSDADCRVAFLWASSPMVWGAHRPHRGLSTLQLGSRARLAPGVHEVLVRFQDDVLKVWFDGGVVLERRASADAAYFERGSSLHLVVQNASVILVTPMGAVGAIP